jgi:rhodanese-related sulfurtransferase
MTLITPQSLHQKIIAGENPLLLDVRTAREFAQVHVPGAILEPLETFQVARVKEQISTSPNAPFYVLCHSGARAKQAIIRLEAAGISQCVLVEGGTLAWTQAGLPVQRQAVKNISLERQVRMTAGILVLVGTVFGAFLHPAILGLPAFVGAGLIFAGVSDKCGMALVLARMPWNRATTITCCVPCGAQED